MQYPTERPTTNWGLPLIFVAGCFALGVATAFVPGNTETSLYTTTAVRPATVSTLKPVSGFPSRASGPAPVQMANAGPAMYAQVSDYAAPAQVQPAQQVSAWAGVFLLPVAALASFLAWRRSTAKKITTMFGIQAESEPLVYAMMSAAGEEFPMKPLNARVVVEKFEAGQATQGGLLLQSMEVEETNARGKIVAVAEGSKLSVGSNVLFGKSSGLQIEVEDKPYTVLMETELYAVYE